MGNCYTAALYMNILSLVSSGKLKGSGERILCFSYGSGAVATAFTLEARSPTNNGGFTLERTARVANVDARLAQRVPRDVKAFGAACDLRKARYGKCDYEPSGPIAELWPGTYYLVKVDAAHRRTYARTPKH